MQNTRSQSGGLPAGGPPLFCVSNRRELNGGQIWYLPFKRKMRKVSSCSSGTVDFTQNFKEKSRFFAKKQEKKTSRMEIFVVVYNTSIEVVLVSAKRRTFKLLSKREMCLLFTRCRLCAFDRPVLSVRFDEQQFYLDSKGVCLWLTISANRPVPSASISWFRDILRQNAFPALSACAPRL